MPPWESRGIGAISISTSPKTEGEELGSEKLNGDDLENELVDGDTASSDDLLRLVPIVPDVVCFDLIVIQKRLKMEEALRSARVESRCGEAGTAAREGRH